MKHLKSTLGWSNPQGLYGYSKNSGYKDLFVYFDHHANKSSTPINKLATKAFEMYGLGGAQLAQSEKPNWGPIRGSVILLRIEPDYNFSPDEVFRPDISLDEMYDTLVFFRDSKLSAQRIALQRDKERMIRSMFLSPPSSFSSSSSSSSSSSPFDGFSFSSFGSTGSSADRATQPSLSDFSHYVGSGGMINIDEHEKQVCDNCGKNESLLRGKELKRCQRCKVAFYCDRSCQKAAWKRHKKICKENQKG